MTQSVLTIIADVEPGKLPALRAVLDQMGPDPAGNPVLALERFATLHFAAFVVADGPGVDPPKLIFESNVDGSVSRWLDLLVATGGDGLDTVLSHCAGYPGQADSSALRSWLDDRVVHPGAFHIGATGRSLDRIRHEQQLYDEIEAFLGREGAAGRLAGVDAATVRARVQDMVRSTPALAWATGRVPERETMLDKLRHRARAGAVIAAAAVALPVLLPTAAVGLGLVLWKERRDPVHNGAPDPALVASLEADEDLPNMAQNHLSSVIPLKPGMLRSTLLPVVLFALNLLTRIRYTKGELGGIPSIHFAHWSVIDDGRHLVFLSNFDGSWESYLGDFIDKAATGLTAVWSNTVDFPRARFLIGAGATDGPRFRQWARANQCRTQVWYSAYPRLTMPVIDNNSAIREGLFATLDEKEAQAWLQRL